MTGTSHHSWSHTSFRILLFHPSFASWSHSRLHLLWKQEKGTCFFLFVSGHHQPLSQPPFTPSLHTPTLCHCSHAASPEQGRVISVEQVALALFPHTHSSLSSHPSREHFSSHVAPCLRASLLLLGSLAETVLPDPCLQAASASSLSYSSLIPSGKPLTSDNLLEFHVLSGLSWIFSSNSTLSK